MEAASVRKCSSTCGGMPGGDSVSAMPPAVNGRFPNDRLQRTLLNGSVRPQNQHALSSIALALLMLISPATVAATNIVRPDGIGALHVGMTISQIERVLKARVQTPTDLRTGTAFKYNRRLTLLNCAEI